MNIGDRLRELREDKKFHKPKLKSERGFSVRMFLVWKTDTLSRLSQL